MTKFDWTEALARYSELRNRDTTDEHATAEYAGTDVAESITNWERLAAFQGLTFVQREGTWVLENMTAQEKAAFQKGLIAGLKARLLAVAQRGFSGNAVSPGNALASLMRTDPASIDPAEVYGIAGQVTPRINPGACP